jgi:hypothetical protein
VSCYQPSLRPCISPSCCHARKSVLAAQGCFPLDDVLTDFGSYVDNNATPTIASNLLEANAVLPWQASGQSAQCFRRLLCATIGYTPACYERQCLLSTTHHAAEWRVRTCAREAMTNP